MQEKPEKESETILAVDPGTEKIGIAVLNLCGDILTKKVIRGKNNFEDALKRLIDEFNPGILVIGNSTGSDRLVAIIRGFDKNQLPIKLVDEKYTSEEARKAWFRRFRGFRLFAVNLGYILGLVKFEIDDDVAVILGKRYLGID
jgi:RNase H-fold protein (predicted Holliday junction resolvase)